MFVFKQDSSHLV